MINLKGKFVKTVHPDKGTSFEVPLCNIINRKEFETIDLSKTKQIQINNVEYNLTSYDILDKEEYRTRYVFNVTQVDKRNISLMKCPICGESGGILHQDPVGFIRVMDPNTTYSCDCNNIHRFWIHPFSSRFIHWNPEASDTDWKQILEWGINNDGSYELIEPDIAKVDRYVEHMTSMIDSYKNRK